LRRGCLPRRAPVNARQTLQFADTISFFHRLRKSDFNFLPIFAGFMQSVRKWLIDPASRERACAGRGARTLSPEQQSHQRIHQGVLVSIDIRIFSQRRAVIVTRPRAATGFDPAAIAARRSIPKNVHFMENVTWSKNWLPIASAWPTTVPPSAIIIVTIS
jgi:hypothetical protein